MGGLRGELVPPGRGGEGAAAPRLPQETPAPWEEYCTRVSSWEREKYIILY